MIQRYCLPGAIGLVLVLLLFGAAMGIEDACRWESSNQITVPAQETPAPLSGDRATYTGTIRVFVTEKVGRWSDSQGKPFHNAFLSFALEEAISLNETDSMMWHLEWDGNDYTDAEGDPYSDLVKSNIEVIAAVFNSASYPGSSDPPSGAMFNVHEIDAVAGAKCGGTGHNLTFGAFTHSVLVQDGSTTW
jgi:hypothetical protein